MSTLPAQQALAPGRYQLGAQIAAGGMGLVFRAFDALAQREVQMASQLAHPNIVEVYDYGRSADGLYYYAMEYLEGINLGELVAKEGALPLARALPILRQLGAGLAVAHRAGLVHRDIKPENIMLCRRGGAEDVVKILDFGLAKNVAVPHSRDLTRGLRILGTLLYMAPERLRNPADVDARSDIYAFGAVAFHMLAGKRMFDTTDDLELTSKILNEEPPRLSTVARQPIPPELDLLVQACLEKRREDRPQRISDLFEVLDALEREAAA